MNTHAREYCTEPFWSNASQPHETLWLLKCLNEFLAVLDVALVVGHAGMENVGEAMLSEKKH